MESRSLKYHALATDYDGTLAYRGLVEATTTAALQRVRDAGLYLMLVTGRQIESLEHTFANLDLFHRVIAENGAVIYEPATGRLELLAPAPPPLLIERLLEARVPLSVGKCIIATVEPYDSIVREALEALGVPWQIVMNKGAVMAVPRDVDKAKGLDVALERLGISRRHTIAIGDAENDLAMLSCCGLAAAVGNALPEVKAIAQVVTTAPRGAGVVELIDQWLAGELD